MSRHLNIQKLKVFSIRNENQVISHLIGLKSKDMVKHFILIILLMKNLLIQTLSLRIYLILI